MVVVLSANDPNAFGAANDTVGISPMLSLAFNRDGKESKVTNLSKPIVFTLYHLELPENVSVACEWSADETPVV